MQQQFNYFDFSNVKFKEKEEKDLCIITPRLHDIDREVLDKVYRSIIWMVKDFKRLCPPHFVYDLYSLYYNRTDEIVWDTSSQFNDTKIRLLKKFNKEKYKIISNMSGVNSFFFLKYLLQIINDFYRTDVPEEVRDKIIQDLRNQKPQTQKKKQQQKQNNTPQDTTDQTQDQQTQQDTETQEEQTEQRVDPTSGISGANQGDSEAPPESFSTVQGGDTAGKEISGDESLASEEQILEEVSHVKSEQEVEEEFEDFLEDDSVSEKIDKNINSLFSDISVLKDNDLLDTEDLQDEKFGDVLENINRIDEIKQQLSQIKFNKGSLQPLIKQVLNESKNYFSSRTKPQDISILESDSLSNLNNIEYLHPILKKIKLFDITTSEKEPIGKLDVYFDVSGSMSSFAYDHVSALTLTKAILLNMMQLGLVEDVFPFESQVCTKLKSEISVILSKTRGGTDLEAVVEAIEATGKNSIIITDAQDTVNFYSEKAFFIGINTNFACIYDERYMERGQLIHYDPVAGTFKHCTKKTQQHYYDN